jgi:hypothetical protein
MPDVSSSLATKGYETMTRSSQILHDLSACHLANTDMRRPGRARAMRVLVPASAPETADNSSRLHLLPQSGFDWVLAPLPFA